MGSDQSSCILVRSTNYDAYDYKLIKINQLGYLEWLQPLNNTPNADYLEEAYTINISDYNYITVGGKAYDETSDTENFKTLQFDASGDVLWERTNSLEGYINLGMAMTSDARNNMYWMCVRSGPDPDDVEEVITQKISFDGEVLWTTIYEDPSLPIGILIDKENIYEYVRGFDGSHWTIGLIKLTQQDYALSGVSLVSCFPNPASDQITFTSDQNLEVHSTETFDAIGRAIALNPHLDKPCSISHLASGAYFTVFHTDAGDFSNSWVKL